MLERVRAIRASERLFWQKVTDLYATSIDYDKDAPTTREFFSTVQNKFHHAIHGHTAAEVIVARADADQPNMRLTIWANAPAGPIRKRDVGVAKNYLRDDELRQLNLIVDQYLSFAELQAQQRRPMHMADWVRKLHDFLTLNDREVLSTPGRVSHDEARQVAEREYARFDERRRLEATGEVSDFDRAVRRLEQRRRGKPKG